MISLRTLGKIQAFPNEDQMTKWRLPQGREADELRRLKPGRLIWLLILRKSKKHRGKLRLPSPR